MANKYEVTCPDCGGVRIVKGKPKYTATIKGQLSARCKLCGAMAGINKRLVAMSMKRESKEVVSCGCVLTIAAPVFVDGCEMASRCEKWEACGNQSACLEVIGMHNWPGFTADCEGFVLKQPDRLIPMSEAER